MLYNDYLPKLGFSDEELSLLAETDSICSGDITEAFSFYEKSDEAFAEYLVSLSEKRGVEIDMLTLYLYLRFAEHTYETYKKYNISDDVFIATMRSHSLLSRVCVEVNGHYGVAQEIYRPWQRRIINSTIFRLGRLEFELYTSKWDFEVDGVSVKVGSPCISVHIPRYEKLDEDLCEAAYAQAREFFKEHFGMDKVVFICHSWLLDPWLCEALPENSAILKFQKKYKILEVEDNVKGATYWIFGGKLDDANAYPEDTSLRRSAKKKILAGERIGTALGARL